MATTHKAIVSMFVRTGWTTAHIAAHFRVTEPYAIDVIRCAIIGGKPSRTHLYGHTSYRKRIDLP